MAERQVIKEKYRKRGLFDFLHFTLACSPSLGRQTASCCRIIPMSATPSVSIHSLPPATGGTDPRFQEVSAFVTSKWVLFWSLYLSLECDEGERDLASPLLACQGVDGKYIRGVGCKQTCVFLVSVCWQTEIGCGESTKNTPVYF